MAWTKRQLVVQAFEEIGLASYVFDLTAEQLQSALRTMDAMVARWDGVGVELGYSLPASPDNSDLNDPSGVPDTAVQAVYLNLACLLGPRFGKAIPQDLRTHARAAYDDLVTQQVETPQVQYPQGMLAGAGNKRWSGTLAGETLPSPSTDHLPLDEDGNLLYGD